MSRTGSVVRGRGRAMAVALFLLCASGIVASPAAQARSHDDGWSSSPAGPTGSGQGQAPVETHSPSPEGATPGSLDPTFSADGMVVTNLTAGDDYARAMVIQPDGRLVVAGRVGGLGGQFLVARYLPSGTLDTTFSGNGWNATNFTNGWDEAFGLVLQPDGKIVVVGDAEGQGGRFGLARYRPNGTLDPTFSGDGKLTTDFGPGFDGASEVILQPNGRLVVAGQASGGNGQFGLARYLANGALDRTFSGDGKVATDFTGRADLAWDLALHSDGRIVAAGGAGRSSSMAVVRYQANGSLDPTFSGNGKLTTNFLRGAEDVAAAVVIQPDDKILVAGTTGEQPEIIAGGRGLRFALVRYNVDGSQDESFSEDGTVVRDLTSGDDFGWDVALQADGKIVVAGVSDANGGQFAVLRFDDEGGWDSSFGGDGLVTTNFTAAFDGALAVGLQADGTIVAAGGSGGSAGRVALTRYLG